MGTGDNEQIPVYKTKETFTMHTAMEQETPLTISRNAQEVLADERLNLKRTMNEDLPSVFQIPAVNVNPVNIPMGNLPEAYNRMRMLSLKMYMAARAYRSAQADQDTDRMYSHYAEAAELQKQFYDSEREAETLQEGIGRDEQQDDVVELQEPKQGYFARKKAEKREKEERSLRAKQLEKEFGEKYRDTAKVKPGEKLDSAFMQSDYVKELILPRETIYKNEEGEKVKTTQSELLAKVMQRTFRAAGSCIAEYAGCKLYAGEQGVIYRECKAGCGNTGNEISRRPDESIVKNRYFSGNAAVSGRWTKGCGIL